MVRARLDPPGQPPPVPVAPALGPSPLLFPRLSIAAARSAVGCRQPGNRESSAFRGLPAPWSSRLELLLPYVVRRPPPLRVGRLAPRLGVLAAGKRRRFLPVAR